MLFYLNKNESITPLALPALQCVAGAMYITGFSESVAEVLGLQGQWVVRGLSAAVLLALLGINLAGVKWIVRLQLLLLAVLAISTLDFVIGTFTHLDPGGPRSVWSDNNSQCFEKVIIYPLILKNK